MSEFVPAEQALFFVRPDRTPVVVLIVGEVAAGAIESIEVPLVDPDSAPRTPVLAGWEVDPRPSVTSIRGPGDLAFTVSAQSGSVHDADDWVAAASRAEGVLVAFRCQALPAEGAGPPEARGGFVGLG